MRIATQTKTSSSSPYNAKKPMGKQVGSLWRMRELLVFDDLIAHKSTTTTGYAR